MACFQHNLLLNKSMLNIWNYVIICFEDFFCKFSSFFMIMPTSGKISKTGSRIFSQNTVMSIYRVHILKSIAGSPVRRQFRHMYAYIKMSIMDPWVSHKLFSFVCCLFKEKLPKICDFGDCLRVKKWLRRLY